MPLILIPKKTKGEFREIYAPSKKEKARLRALLPELNQIALDNCGGCVHGFMPGKSPVTNAREHIGYQYSLSFDLKDFFDTVTVEMIKDYFPIDKVTQYFINGRAYQGLPTSPQIANLAAIKMDTYLLAEDGLLLFHPFKYTRYADDLTFSFNHYGNYEKILKSLPFIVKSCGFQINEKKTRLQSSKFGRRIITGISVGEHDICVPRKVKKLLKVMEYKKNKELVARNPYTARPLSDKNCGTHIHGLREWAKLRLPHFARSHSLEVINSIISYMKVVNLVKQGQYFNISKLETKLASLNTRYGQKRYIAESLKEIQKHSEITPEKIKFFDQLVRDKEIERQKKVKEICCK